ncbi:unnamed protein product [Prorocentrum cordatum]|uniref:Mei2-like C-terminal RNA recognition motif domain-containing protein n=1 Tax=Prorocentrum cordatum TaxID=2364126 RepID=A0ABN9P9K6_9DINO|nr:unnamed protein product [Polarella glacialis]
MAPSAPSRPAAGARATADAAAGCWSAGFTRGLCCSGVFGPQGNSACFSFPDFTFLRCCGATLSGGVAEVAAAATIWVPGGRSTGGRVAAAGAWAAGRRAGRAGRPERGLPALLHRGPDPRRMRRVLLCAEGDAGGECESYTLGDGLCALEVAGPRGSAALVRSPCNPPSWLCPLAAPVALLLLPKAASTALANWAARLDRLPGRWSALRAAAAADLASAGTGRATERLLARRFANRSRAEVLSLVDRFWGRLGSGIAPHLRRRTLVFSQLRERRGAVDAVPPAGDCPACCEPARWRTRVAVVRHPLARLVSYFGMAWAGNPLRGNFSSWGSFAPWVRHASGHEAAPEAGRVWESSDDYHTRPLSSWLAELGSAAAGVTFLRLELLEADLAALSRALCALHGFCRPLPPLTRRRLEGAGAARGRGAPASVRGLPPLAALWADPAVSSAVLAGYGADFDLLGYDRGGGDFSRVGRECRGLPPEWREARTAMMRNLPNKYTQQMLPARRGQPAAPSRVQAVHTCVAEVLANRLQWQTLVQECRYAFINFIQPCYAWMFKQTYEGRKMSSFNSSKIVGVMPAALQGFQANYDHYSTARVNRGDPSTRPLFLREPDASDAGPGAAGSRRGRRRRGGGASAIDLATRQQQRQRNVMERQQREEQDGRQASWTQEDKSGDWGDWGDSPAAAAAPGVPLKAAPQAGAVPPSEEAPERAQWTANFCPHCGEKVQAHFLFCSNCGGSTAMPNQPNPRWMGEEAAMAPAASPAAMYYMVMPNCYSDASPPNSGSNQTWLAA